LHEAAGEIENTRNIDCLRWEVASGRPAVRIDNGCLPMLHSEVRVDVDVDVRMCSGIAMRRSGIVKP